MMRQSDMSENTPDPHADSPARLPFSSLLQKSASLHAQEPPMPSSKPLQIFLLIAFIITGAAYVVNQWSEMTSEKARAKFPSRLHELVKSQSVFIERTDAGKKALARKHPDQAVSDFRQALEAQQSAEGHLNLGTALAQVGNPEAACAQFREAVRLDPKLLAAYDAWGRTLSSEGKPEEAVTVYQTALQMNPDAGIIHYNLGDTLRAMGRNAAAARRAAEAEGKADVAAADAQQSKDFASQALQHYVKASRQGVDSAPFWTSYGESLNDQERYADAVSTLKRAIAKDSEAAAAHFELARAQARLGQYDAAIGNYEKVLTLTPDNPEVLNNLALLYTSATNEEVRSPQMAIQLAVRACDATASQNARFVDTLARAYAASGNFFQAISWEDKALKRAGQLNDKELTRELEARYQLYLDHKTD
jgi:tetratricopeptide (TPR) repeat protein